MNNEIALNFLRSHKNMPIDSSQSDISMFDDVRKHFIQNPDECCIPLFLETFGDHMGWGLFQLCDDVFNKYSNETITPHLKKHLKSKNKGTRWWATHWAFEFCTPDLTDELIEITESKEDIDAHYFALAALGEIYRISRNQKVLLVLKNRKLVENDPEIIELLDGLLEEC
jgi:hypothetical protein